MPSAFGAVGEARAPVARLHQELRHLGVTRHMTFKNCKVLVEAHAPGALEEARDP